MSADRADVRPDGPPAARPAASVAPATVGEALAQARRRLSAAAVETPGLDARLLVSEATGLPLPALLADGARPLSPEAAHRLDAYLERRAAGEPVGRIRGRRAFWTLDLALSPATLEPRPDTEVLVAAVLDHLAAEGRRDAPIAIADLGTGSGAILLALLSECPNAVGIGVDLSEEALRTARRNAAVHGLDGRAVFARGDFAAAISERVDVVVSNPPYVSRAELDRLEPGVRDHDPALALDGGADGLAAYRAILRQLDDRRAAAASPKATAPALFVETSPALEGALASLAQARGWMVAARHRDLAGRIRALRLCLPK